MNIPGLLDKMRVKLESMAVSDGSLNDLESGQSRAAQPPTLHSPQPPQTIWAEISIHNGQHWTAFH